MSSRSTRNIERAAPRRLYLAFTVAGLLLFWACSTDPVSSFLLRRLERNYPPTAVDSVDPADAIVVLGGGTTIPAEAREISPSKPGTSRYVYAARLFQAGKAPAIVVIGGPAAPNGVISAASSEEIGQFLVDAGIPPQAIVKVPDSATTAQSAVSAKPIIAGHSFQRVLLVTSALHMPRARAIFRSTGIDVIPASSDVEAPVALSPTWQDLRPKALALRRTGRVLHEYIGLLVYPLQLKYARQPDSATPIAPNAD